MAKFHTGSNGRIAPCTASKRACPLGGPEVHFDSMEVAVRAVAMAQLAENDFYFTEKHKVVASWRLEASKLPPISSDVSIRDAVASCWITDRERIEEEGEDGPFLDVVLLQQKVLELEGNPAYEDWGGLGLDDEFFDALDELEAEHRGSKSDRRYLSEYFPRIADALEREDAVREILLSADLGLPHWEPEVYEHPQGKRIVVERDGSLTVTRAGKPAKSGATLEQLRAGRGAWKRADSTVVTPEHVPSEPERDDAERERIYLATMPPSLRGFHIEDGEGGSWFNEEEALQFVARGELRLQERRAFEKDYGEWVVAQQAIGWLAGQNFADDDQWRGSPHRAALAKYLPKSLERLEHEASTAAALREILAA